MRILCTISLLPILVTGCLPLTLREPWATGKHTALVPSNPFANNGGSVALSPRQFSYEPADKKLATRVHAVGQQLLTANPEISMKPLFATFGTDRLELFHISHRSMSLPKETLESAQTDGRVVYISEGLVRRCKSDGHLAALLAHELAQMVVEREVLASPHMRRTDERPPVDVIIGSGIGSTGTTEIRQAELARYEMKRREAKNPLPLPDPEKLVQRYLKSAGYKASDATAVIALLDKAEETYFLEKQLKQSAHSKWKAATK